MFRAFPSNAKGAKLIVALGRNFGREVENVHEKRVTVVKHQNPTELDFRKWKAKHEKGQGGSRLWQGRAFARS